MGADIHQTPTGGRLAEIVFTALGRGTYGEYLSEMVAILSGT
jgi:hypothetical protein